LRPDDASGAPRLAEILARETRRDEVGSGKYFDGSDIRDNLDPRELLL
jgi:hypothetical protein